MNEFFLPCLSNSNTYDRAAGYFHSSIYQVIKPGLESFIARDGKIRLITSVKITDEDVELIRQGYEERQFLEKYLDVVYEDMYARREEPDVANLCWLIKHGYLDVRITIPDFSEDISPESFYHDKIGIFGDGDDFVVFLGSNNESQGGWIKNFESFEVFCSWDSSVQSRVRRRRAYFERLWKGECPHLYTYAFPQAYQERLKALAPAAFVSEPHDHPKTKTISSSGEIGSKTSGSVNRWRHQDEAVNSFLKHGNGILEMATGTGKTRTALRIMNVLREQGKIDSAIITVSGTDLLDQWAREVTTHATSWSIFKYYDDNKELSEFLLNPKGAVLIVSRDFLRQSMPFIRRKDMLLTRSLLICDEVHGLGTATTVRELQGQLSTFAYRLGLSATPDREYDEVGNEFIKNEIGEVIFRFQLEDAIKRGILCEFDYYPLKYDLTDEDREKLHRLIKIYNAQKSAGVPVDDEEFYREMARVKKLSPAKLPVFKEFVRQHPDILERCIIFVETIEYGEEVQKIVIEHQPYFHTYYGNDDKDNLERFSRSELDCLVTCKRISEGIDIRSVKNVVLFSSDRSKLVTIQRIGRSLRVDPSDPHKRATVVDFVCFEDDSVEDTADKERMTWLSKVAQTRREE
ncbi:MAG: DEAD/DEAH box helicase family protein [Alicyclobacillus macrosporangiidus]|uniref:DEAD/DEAH box helicase family protein n=1 Tax=Alicyclobacillus macrosporangiidus TaxID=392015 RepID=UPI0026F0D099|nr:DEAD/DEAH box helicase family protein [Alicyclobacillus macrosporangiidus]MCL6597494.1 DEAD/DEAH box helicase family protein [Alicyclobacillus macrosporangiidus]